MSWKKMITGEKMPDKDDPRYRARYEREVEAGRRFARAVKIDRLAAKVQEAATRHRTLFLTLVFGLVALSLTLNIVQVVRISREKQQEPRVTAVEHQEHLLKKKQPITPRENEDNRQD